LRNRIITGVVAAAIIGVVLSFGNTAAFVLILAAEAFALAEFFFLVYDKDPLDFSLAALAATVLTASARAWPERFIAVYMAGVLCLFSKDILRRRSDLARILIGIWGFTYISLLGASAVFILNESFQLFLAVTSAAVACDIAAYFGGTWFGRRKLAPSISPNKTLEGSICGFLAALASFAAALFIPMGYSAAFLLSCGVAVGIMSQFGDLAASMVKRYFNIKDYSSLLPGHGGVLDRVDSLLFSYATAYCLLSFFGYN